ncbi:MAG: polyprenyl synthetase family protein [Patescibacteria group bacterium]
MNFLKYKPRIDRRISELLAKSEKNLPILGYWGRDAMKRLRSFALRGKSLRGSLVLFSYRLFKNVLKPEVIDVAAALELIHSALLIQDDIMDEDEVRRGIKTIHLQYAGLGQIKKIPMPRHFGESAAVCLSDIAFFLAFGALGRLRFKAALAKDFWELFSQELATTAVGQMEEAASFGIKRLNLNLYRAKTARYTFVLPLLAGAMLAGKRRSELKKFEKLGEILGVIFQLKDDELDKKRSGTGKEILRLARKAERLILTLPAPKQKEAFSGILAYNLSRLS